MRSLEIRTRRFVVESTIEVPLVIEATDWASALATALRLLDRVERAPALRCALLGEGRVTAADPDRGEHFWIREEATPVPARRAA